MSFSSCWFPSFWATAVAFSPDTPSMGEEVSFTLSSTIPPFLDSSYEVLYMIDVLLYIGTAGSVCRRGGLVACNSYERERDPREWVVGMEKTRENV
jgi:hypothetical protein